LGLCRGFSTCLSGNEQGSSLRRTIPQRSICVIEPCDTRCKDSLRSNHHARGYAGASSRALQIAKKERLFDCAPQLNYEVFVEGTFEHPLREYLRGIAESSSHLAALGASTEQIAEFEAILESAVDCIVAERQDHTKP